MAITVFTVVFAATSTFGAFTLSSNGRSVSENTEQGAGLSVANIKGELAGLVATVGACIVACF